MSSPSSNESMEVFHDAAQGDESETTHILPPGSLQRLISENEEEDEYNTELRRNSALVEEQLLSFYEHQLEQASLHDDQAKQRTIRKPLPPLEPLPIHKPHAYPCQGTHASLPSPPSVWPQAPVMLRPTPRSDTKIRGIRRAKDIDYQHFEGFCAGCILPVNTGKELPGQSLVIDFDSRHFVGTLLMRIKNVPSLSSEGNESYFDGKKRKFQAVVKGKFKTPLKMSACVTGQTFSRPAGSLPAKWIVTSFIKFISSLAPQLEATIDADEPKFLTPLVATAHSVLEKESTGHGDNVVLPEHDDCHDCDDDDEHHDRLQNYRVYSGARDIEAHIEEPPADDPTSVMKHVSTNLSDAGSIGKRQRVRKKAFNYIAAHQSDEPCFELDKEYSFEFYQHLLVFDDCLAIDMGRPIGNIPLAPITDGQPLKCMAAFKTNLGELQDLWSFDLWHESLFPYAQAAEEDVLE